MKEHVYVVLERWSNGEEWEEDREYWTECLAVFRKKEDAMSFCLTGEHTIDDGSGDHVPAKITVRKDSEDLNEFIVMLEPITKWHNVGAYSILSIGEFELN